jgi:hypothetical protein
VYQPSRRLELSAEWMPYLITTSQGEDVRGLRQQLSLAGTLALGDGDVNFALGDGLETIADGLFLAVENRNGRVTLTRDESANELTVTAEIQCAGRTAEEAKRRADATTLGANARRAWESWFAPDVYAGRCLEWIHHLQQHRRHDEAAAFRRWPRLIAAARAQEAGGGRFRRLWRSIRSRLRNPSS